MNVPAGAKSTTILKRLWSLVPSGGSLPESVWRGRYKFLVGLTWFHAIIIALAGPVLGHRWELSLGAIFEHETGTQMIHVPFKDTLQIFTSIANGEVTWAVATASSTGPMVKAGRVKLIAVAAPKRLASHPDVPTVEEAGGPKDFEVEAWLVLLGPRGMAPELAQKIGTDVQKVLATPEMRKRTEGLGFETYQASPLEIAAKIRAELKTNAGVIRRVGAKAD